MEFYIEYPVACQTCNENIACRVEDYLSLINSGFSIEEALNTMGIDLYCSRLAMRGVGVPFNMENRGAIEGVVSVERADYESANYISTGKVSFDLCTDFNNQSKTKLKQIVQQSSSSSSNAPIITKVTQNRFNIGKGTQERIDETVPAAFNQPIELNVIENTEFEAPTVPGVPTFNPRKGIPQEMIIVGDNSKVKILTGRTYLAE